MSGAFKEFITAKFMRNKKESNKSHASKQKDLILTSKKSLVILHDII